MLAPTRRCAPRTANPEPSAPMMRSASSTRCPRGDLLDQDGELVAAEAPGEVDGADRGRQARRHLDEQLVTGAVAEPVVDRLEAVEVDEQHGHVVAVVVARRRPRARPGRGTGCGWAGSVSASWWAIRLISSDSDVRSSASSTTVVSASNASWSADAPELRPVHARTDDPQRLPRVADLGAELETGRRFRCAGPRRRSRRSEVPVPASPPRCRRTST